MITVPSSSLLSTSLSMRNAGATPKLTMSHRLSNWPPKLEVLWLIRASRPSSMSANMASSTMYPATAKQDHWPASGLTSLLARAIAVKPNTPLRIVIREGNMAMYLTRCLRTRRNSLPLCGRGRCDL